MEQNEQLALSHEAVRYEIEACFVLHGRISRKKRTAMVAELEALGISSPRVLLDTGCLVNGGFYPPPQDSLILTLPISWKETLQQ